MLVHCPNVVGCHVHHCCCVTNPSLETEPPCLKLHMCSRECRQFDRLYADLIFIFFIHFSSGLQVLHVYRFKACWNTLEPVRSVATNKIVVVLHTHKIMIILFRFVSLFFLFHVQHNFFIMTLSHTCSFLGGWVLAPMYTNIRYSHLSSPTLQQSPYSSVRVGSA